MGNFVPRSRSAYSSFLRSCTNVSPTTPCFFYQILYWYDVPILITVELITTSLSCVPLFWHFNSILLSRRGITRLLNNHKLVKEHLQLSIPSWVRRSNFDRGPCVQISLKDIIDWPGSISCTTTFGCLSGFSQAFYREELFKGMGFETREDFLTKFWDEVFLHKDANNLLHLLDVSSLSYCLRKLRRLYTDILYYDRLGFELILSVLPELCSPDVWLKI